LNEINHIIYIFIIITLYKYILYNYTPENERNGSFSGCVNGGAGQRKAQPPKTSVTARFREVWVVVVARRKPNRRKRAVTLIFGGCGWWWWPEEGPTTENERNRSFSGVVDGGGGQRKDQPPKTSSRARFRGWCGVVLGRGRANPRK
jgi:hypothetical protein